MLNFYAKKYSGMVCGWWIDGCYDGFGYNDRLLSLYYDAVKSEDPDYAVTFNNGVKKKLEKWYSKEDFTAGEFNEFEYIPESRFVNGAQSHILAPLGTGAWCTPGSNYTRKYIQNYIDRVNSAGGVLTVDIAIEPDGSFDPVQMKILSR